MYEPLGICVQACYFIHGEYDWMILFTANNIIDAKKFCESVTNKYSSYNEKMHLSQILLTLREQNIQNPHTTDLKNFFK